MTLAIRSVELPTHVSVPYVERGDADGLPVVLVHAIADSWRVFEQLLVRLPRRVRAFAPSQRGHGDADRPPSGYRPEDFAADLAAFLDAAGVEKAVLVGGSSGGVIARRFAIDHPGRTLGLVLLGSPFSLRSKPAAVEMWETTFARLEDPVDAGLVRAFAEETIGSAVPRAVFDVLLEENLKVPAHVWKATMRGLLDDRSDAELGRIAAPTLVGWGERDGLLTRSEQELLVQAIPGARLSVHPGGHMFYVENPEGVAAELAAFAAELGA